MLCRCVFAFKAKEAKTNLVANETVQTVIAEQQDYNVGNHPQLVEDVLPEDTTKRKISITVKKLDSVANEIALALILSMTDKDTIRKVRPFLLILDGKEITGEEMEKR